MTGITDTVWRYIAMSAAAALGVALVALVFVFWMLGNARDDLAAARAAAAANAKAVEEMGGSLAAAEEAAVKQTQAASETVKAKETARHKGKEARKNETYRAWADTPAHDDTWRLLNEAAPFENSPGTAAVGAPGTMPGNASTEKRH